MSSLLEADFSGKDYRLPDRVQIPVGQDATDGSVPGLIVALLPESELLKPPRDAQLLGYVH